MDGRSFAELEEVAPFLSPLRFPARCAMEKIRRQKSLIELETSSVSLEEIAIPEDLIAGIEIPDRVDRLIVETEKRITSFVEKNSKGEFFGFIQSDFRATYQALSWLKGTHHALGTSFCEWGSGIGAVAMLAAIAGFRSCGIEVKDALVEESISLAGDFNVKVEFVSGSFIPEDSHDLLSAPEEFAWLDLTAEPAYDELGYDPDNFDVVFAYPWPSEQHLIFELFEDCASNGALLLTYHGENGIRLHRCIKSSADSSFDR